MPDTIEQVLAAQAAGVAIHVTETGEVVTDQPMPGVTDVPKLVARAAARVDAVTEDRLLNQFQYPFGTYWRMNLVDQQNFAARYAAREIITYPFSERLRDRDTEYTFKTKEDFEKFYLAWTRYREKTLERGRTDKKALQAMTVSELRFYLANHTA